VTDDDGRRDAATAVGAGDMMPKKVAHGGCGNVMPAIKVEGMLRLVAEVLFSVCLSAAS